MAPSLSEPPHLWRKSLGAVAFLEPLGRSRPELPRSECWVLSASPQPFPHPAGKPTPPPHVHRSGILAPRILWDPPLVSSLEDPPSLHKLHRHPAGAHFLKPAALSGSNRRPSMSSFLTNCSTSFMSFFRSSKSLWTSCSRQREEKNVQSTNSHPATLQKRICSNHKVTESVTGLNRSEVVKERELTNLGYGVYPYGRLMLEGSCHVTLPARKAKKPHRLLPPSDKAQPKLNGRPAGPRNIPPNGPQTPCIHTFNTYLLSAAYTLNGV